MSGNLLAPGAARARVFFRSIADTTCALARHAAGGRDVEGASLILRLTFKHFASLIVVAAPAAAFAQTSVTLYGRIDGGVEYLNHIGTPSGS
uniref:porin n=1 Tax=Burkholderia sp. BCC1998 TaxID=2817447 RepID=UPI002AB627D9